MANFLTVFRKELADHLGSKRYLILFILIMVLSTISAYQGATSVKSNLGGGLFSGSTLTFTAIFTNSMGGFPFTYFMMLFGPIIGLSLGFDAISKERASGSLSVLLSQPIFRDSVINGKFLAGVTALSLMVASTVGIMVGIAIPIIGFGPTGAETLNIIVFTLLTILYVAFWLALSMLFSTLFKKTTTSILAVVSSWIFFVFAMSIIAMLLSTLLVPATSPYSSSSFVTSGNGTFIMPDQTQTRLYQDAMEQRSSLNNFINSISPSYLYTQASGMILTGRNSGIIYFSSSPTTQGATDVWPHITALTVACVLCFIGAYIIFLRREIRPGS